MSSPLVTVLVAVYNTKAYLPQCLDSLLAQTHEALQIICIDDASDDGSSDVLKDYARRDERIRLISLSRNSGQAHARNRGLAEARGAYICFLDSDDWMSPDCIAQAVQTFQAHPQTGCVLFDTLYHYEDGRQSHYPMPDFEVLSGEKAFELSLTWKIHGVYMVTAELHRRHPYDESAHAFSDDNTTRLHYLSSEEVRVCEGIYHYRQHSASVSHRYDVGRCDYLTANLSMKRTLEDIGVSEELLTRYEEHRWLNLISVYMIYFKARSRWSQADRDRAMAMLRQTWDTIAFDRVSAKLKRKFGYMPFTCSWGLFRCQEELYFTLRRWLGR